MFASLAVAADKPTASPATLADLSWLAGDWRGSDADMVSQEVWTAAAGDSMLGMWRLVLEGKLKLSEQCRSCRSPRGR
jgi:hypothetical protein